MKNIIRVSGCVHRIASGNAARCGGYALKAINDAAAIGSDIIVLPRLSLCGAAIGSLTSSSIVCDDCENAISEIASQTKDTNAYIIVSSPIKSNGKIVPATTVLYKGEKLADIPENCEDTLLFGCGDSLFAVVSCRPEDIFIYGTKAVNAGADIVICQSSAPSYAGYKDECRKLFAAFSKSAGCAAVVCCSNIDETTFPDVYTPFAGIFECGSEIAWQTHISPAFSANGDIDSDIIASQKKVFTDEIYPIGFHELNDKSGLLRKVVQNPFLPEEYMDSISVTAEYFDLQVRGLMGRLKNTGIKKAVVGISGGLDSTLAVLVASEAFERLGLPSKNIIGITMPGFGTTGRTYENALALLDALGTDKREISIKNACTEHLENIGHGLKTHDITYENAQARERTQILFDIANWEGALVIGTGDLSEAALGWCTFGGDHLSGYNVNASITKTMARCIVKYLSQSPSFAEARSVLEDILDTPVSPELIPSDNGQIGQKTENILGAYELHDFFIYYFVKYSLAPSKIFDYARNAFEDVYSEEYILNTLKTFIKRFFSSQFKRACSSEGCPNIAPVSLSSSRFSIPSDMSADFMISELEAYISEK